MSKLLHPDFLARPVSETYLLALSGGRDSVALLNLLLDHGVKQLILCHINHNLRGEESDQDAAFVQQLAEQYNLTHEITHVNVQQRMHDTGESLELAARNTRHEHFSRCAKKHQCNKVLFAHHADDQAETILFKLLRGSSGLRGMDYSSKYEINGNPLHFIRPLLFTSRHDIDKYLTARHIPYREDSSNAEAIAVRNRLRNEAIPLLNDIMGRDVSPAINRAATLSTLQQLALRKLLEQQSIEDPQGRLYLPSLKTLTIALQHIAVHDYLKKHGITNLSHELVEQCLLVIDGKGASKLNLPGNRFFRRKEQRAFIQ